MHACMHMCILHYIISCAYITKRLHYSCCDITSFLSSSSLASMAVLGQVELALGIDDLVIKKSGYRLLNCFELVLPYDLFLQPSSLQV